MHVFSGCGGRRPKKHVAYGCCCWWRLQKGPKLDLQGIPKALEEDEDEDGDEQEVEANAQALRVVLLRLIRLQ